MTQIDRQPRAFGGSYTAPSSSSYSSGSRKERTLVIADLERLFLTFGPHQLLEEQTVGSIAFREIAIRLARRAREADPVRAEQMIISLRKEWRDLPFAPEHMDDVVRTAVWDRLVTLCIKAFYPPRPKESLSSRNARIP